METGVDLNIFSFFKLIIIWVFFAITEKSLALSNYNPGKFKKYVTFEHFSKLIK